MHLMEWNGRKGEKAGVAFTQISAHAEGNKQNSNDKMGLYVEMYLETRTLTTLDYLCLGAVEKSSKAHSLEGLECQPGHQGYA